MSRRIALLALGLALLLGTVPLSGAVFTARASSQGVVRAAVDWTLPDVVMGDPGALLRGMVTLTATATDADTAIASVTIEIAMAGTGAWTTVCTTTAAPYGCTLATTTLADGRYDLRAVAVDVEGNRATSSLVLNRTVDNRAPFVEVVDPEAPLRGTATIATLVSDAGTGVASVRIQRALSGETTWTDLCTATTAPWSCSWTTSAVASDYYDLRAIAVDGAGNAATSPLVEVLVDNVVPTVSMVDPGQPLRGAVTLAATASDALSGVASVAIQVAPAGSTAWTTACTSTTGASPWTCRWTTTTVVDGSYSFRAVATDVAGNTATGTLGPSRTVDNTASSVSVQDPGAFLRGIVTITADANSAVGVTSVRIQRAPSGTSTWTDLCTDTTAPYSCTWNTTLVADALYDLRAILVDGSGKVTTSTVVAQRRVDNTPVRGTDVQVTRGPGTVGRVDAGDAVVLTYSESMNLASIMPGWTGGSQPVVVRLRDGGLVGGANTDDTIDVFTTTSLATPVRVGSVNLRSDLVKGGKTVVFNATITQATVGGGTVVTLTIGSQVSGGGLRTPSTLGTMIWTPSALGTDLSGNACSTAPVTESGAADRDF